MQQCLSTHSNHKKSGKQILVISSLPQWVPTAMLQMLNITKEKHTLIEKVITFNGSWAIRDLTPNVTRPSNSFYSTTIFQVQSKSRNLIHTTAKRHHHKTGSTEQLPLPSHYTSHGKSRVKASTSILRPPGATHLMCESMTSFFSRPPIITLNFVR